MLQVIGGDCETAIGGLAVIENNNLKLKAQLFSDSGSKSFEHQITGQRYRCNKYWKRSWRKIIKSCRKEFKKK